VAIFLDRRIDHGRLVTLPVRNQPVEVLFRQIAISAEAELSTLGPVIYLGPPQTASQLASLAALRKQDVSRLSGDARARLMRTQAWQWPEFTQPRQLLSELARQAGLEVENPESIPHDLWPAASLPALPWVDRLTLLLAGFGLTYELPGRGDSIRLVPMPADVQNTASPAAKNTVPPGRITKGGGQKVYTMKFENQSAGNVVKSGANLIGKEMKFDPALLEKLKQPVTLDVKDVPLNELLEATLKPLGLTHRMTASALEVAELK
jgi:hypothetical protein